jgi:ABC-type phosphate transport system substrate-binding protein
MVVKWQRVAGLGAALSTVAALFTVSPALAGPVGTAGGPTPDHIMGSGSDTTQILMLHLDGLYNVSEGCLIAAPNTALDLSCQAPDPAGTITSENYEHDIISEADFVGSSTGIKQLCTQGQAGTTYIDFARSSRASKASDCTGLHFVAYARDGISVEAFDAVGSGIHAMANTDPLCVGLGWCLSQTQVKGIYANCSITDWQQVNSALGAPLTIQIYTPQSGSGTRGQFETFLGISDSSVCITADGQPASHAQVPENQNTGIAAADKNSFIFPFSFALYSTEVNTTGAAGGYQLASIDGIAVNSTTIADGTFPYGRFVYNVFCSTTALGTCGAGTGHIVTQKTVDYIGEEGWICKPGVNENGAWMGNMNVPALDGAQPNAMAPHVVSPHYGVNWAKLISNKIKARGFGPLAIATIGGGDLNQDHCRLSVTT